MTNRARLVIVILAAALTLGVIGKADSLDDARMLHDEAHFSTGAVIQFGGYGIWKAIMNKEDRTTAIIFAVLTTAIVAASKEASDWCKPGGQFSGRNLAYGMLGAGAATGAIVLFGF